jgi:hypothetical protein
MIQRHEKMSQRNSASCYTRRLAISLMAPLDATAALCHRSFTHEEGKMLLV